MRTYPVLPSMARTLTAMLAAASSFLAIAAAAQTTDEAASQPSEATAPAQSGQVYTPDYFARFSPRTALDMLNQVPGFDVEQLRPGENRRLETQQRGFGQASENILLNGQRLSSKADSVADQLSRISADSVVRIEILNGAALDLPGLSGQVANIVTKSRAGISGRFNWAPEYRVIGNDLVPLKGTVSLAGSLGDLGFSLALESNDRSLIARGPTVFADANGALITQQETDYIFGAQRRTLTGALRYQSGAVTVNLNGKYGLIDSFADERDQNTNVGASDSMRTRLLDYGGNEYELGGDLAFPLGPGELKLIGVASGLDITSDETAITTRADMSPDTGTEFFFVQDTSERIARAEYGWRMFALDWQLSGEGAFNRLESSVDLALLNPAGEFVPIPFPGGNGGVTEDRYETILSASGTLLPGVTFQLGGGAEFSTIAPLGDPDAARRFTRPKGTLGLAWQANDGLNLSFELARRVGQLNFSDFLATVSLAENTENAANFSLVPQQSWEVELEAAKSLGPWGNATLTLFHHEITDLVDFIALPDGSAARGNIENATRTGAEIDATLELAQIGWRGARLDVSARIEDTSLLDPVDDDFRPISLSQSHRVAIDLRHDIPGSDLAWGGGFLTSRLEPSFRVNEFTRTVTGPDFWSAFVEHKDVRGLTVRAEAVGLFGPRRRQFRTLFDGVRGRDPVASTEFRNQRQGTLLILSIAGNF